MKTLLTIILSIANFCFLGQMLESNKIVKSGKIFTNRELSYFYENDSRGNTIFTKNDGMNGPITMLFVGKFDSLNRETRNYFAHSNIGFSISENIYESDRILHYEYYTDSVDEGAYERAVLNTINSQQEFLASKTIQTLLRSEKRLTGIDILDANKNIITEIYFSEEGDTSSVNMYEYDSNNRQVLFRYGIHNEEPWTWDIYSFYDSHSNLIQSIRLSSENNIKDTTEIYTYQYDSTQNLISESYYHKKDFGNRTEYFYNANGHVIEERFYEGEEFVLDVLTKYKYTPEGMIFKKIQRDFRGSRRGKKEVFRYEVRFW